MPNLDHAVRLDKDFDLSQFVNAGDLLMWSQASAEPTVLTTALVNQRHKLGKIKAFLGVTTHDVITPSCTDTIELLSYCCVGKNKVLYKSGVLDIIPCHYSQLPALVTSSHLAPDVVFLHLSRPGPDGTYSVGIVNDYVLTAASRARVVIAQVNENMPWVYGSQVPEDVCIDAYIETSTPLADIGSVQAGEVEHSIASYVTGLIPNGASLEMGIGTIPDAIIKALNSHKNLGIHSGMLGDSFIDLIESGAVDNSFKNIDKDISVAGVLMGTSRLYQFVQNNKNVRLEPSSYTHNAGVLSKINNFYAINSAIEVDLTGQVNAEVVNGSYIGAIGGQTDFVRGAQLSTNGRSVIALPSVTRKGDISRIVPKISSSVVTTARSDADTFVTEWGVAELKGLSIKERVKRMINIAHPEHRDYLWECVRSGYSVCN